MGICIVYTSDFFELLAYVFSLGATLIIFFSVTKEYYDLFIKSKTQEKGTTVKFTAATTFSTFTILMIGVIAFMLIITLITVFMLLRIYLKKRTLTHAFMSLIELGAWYTTILLILDYLYKVPGTREFSSETTTALLVIVIVTGVVALLEQKITQTNLLLKGVISASQESSLNVASMATELSASASEVNAAAEEIASQTQEMALNTQNIYESSNEIQRIMEIIINSS
jgi:methyl-accepting chemotaxis protein